MGVSNIANLAGSSFTAGSSGKIPQELLDALPPAEGYAKAVFPSLDEQAAAKTPITGNWDAVIGANVQ